MALLKGGQSKSTFYRLKKKNDTYVVLDKLTDTEVSQSPSEANAAYILNGVIASTKPSWQTDGTVKISFDQYAADEDFFKFIDKVMITSEETGEEVTMENGVKYGGASAGDDYPILIISYLHKNEDKMFVLSAMGQIEATSGSFETSSDRFTKPTYEFVGIKNMYEFTIPATLFDGGLVEVLTSLKIGAKKCFVRTFLPTAE